MTQWKISWHHKMLGIPELWEKNLAGQKVTVALLDTGLARPVGLDSPGFEYLDSRGREAGAADPNGHGTCCGSAIASYQGGALGIAPHCKLVSLQVLDTGTTIDDVEAAFTYLADQRPDVDIVSCSFILSNVTQGISAAIQKMTNAGQLIVGAAGDNNLVQSPFPEGADNVMAVAAVDQGSQPLQGARVGDFIDVAAPGKDIPVLLTQSGRFGLFNESSAAAAITSGILALVLSRFGDMAARRTFALGVRGLLRSTASPLPGDPPGTVGRGLVNPAALFAALPQ